MKRLFTDFCLFSFGYSAYSLIELAWRRYTHSSMGLAGGICFVALYKIYKKHRNLSVLKKCIIGSAVITAVEYIFGVIFNRKLKMKVWDYSSLPLNISGQVCLLYSFLWVILCLPICYLVPKISKLERAL